MSQINKKSEFIDKLKSELFLQGISDTEEILSDFIQHFEQGAAEGKTEEDVCKALGTPAEIAVQYIPKEGNKPLTFEEFNSTEPSGEPLVLKLEEEDIVAEMEELIKTAPKYESVSPIVPDDYIAVEKGQNIPKADDNYQFGADIQSKENINPNEETFESKNSYNNSSFNASENETSYFSMNGLITCLIVDLFVFAWLIPLLISIMGGFFSFSLSGVFTGIGMAFSNGFGIFHHPFGSLTGCLLGVAIFALGCLGVLIFVAMVKSFIKLIKGIINWNSRKISGKVVFGNKDKRDYRGVGA